MFDGNRDKRPKTRLIVNAAIVGFGVATIVILWGFSQKAEYEREADQAYKEYASHSYYPQRNACLNAPVFNQIDCLSQHDANAREYQRGEEDLVSQRVTALWTVLMGGAAIIGMMLSAIGVFLVWTTFEATKEANKFAKVSADAAVQSAKFVEDSFRRIERPYLHIKITEHVRLDSPGEGYPTVKYTFNNYGKSPAIVRSYNILLQSLPDKPHRLPMHNLTSWYEVIEPGKGFNNPLSSNVEGAAPGRAYHRHSDIFLHGYIQYDDQMGAMHTDRFCLRWSPTGFRVEGGSEYNYRETTYPTPKI